MTKQEVSLNSNVHSADHNEIYSDGPRFKNVRGSERTRRLAERVVPKRSRNNYTTCRAAVIWTQTSAML